MASPPSHVKTDPLLEAYLRHLAEAKQEALDKTPPGERMQDALTLLAEAEAEAERRRQAQKAARHDKPGP